MTKNLVISGKVDIVKKFINRISVIDENGKVKTEHDKVVREETCHTLNYLRVVPEYGFLELLSSRSEKIALRLDKLSDAYTWRELLKSTSFDTDFIITTAEAAKFEEKVDSYKNSLLILDPSTSVLDHKVMTEKEYREHQKQKKGR